MKLKIRVALLAFVTAVIPLSLSAEGGSAQAVASRDAARTYANLPLRFEPAIEQGHFLARSSGYAVLVGPAESAIAITAKSGSTQTLRFRFDGSNAAARIEAIEPLPGITNYYIGQDQSKWRLGVRNFAKLRTKDAYPGVDVVYYGDNRRLEFDFVVAPMADPSAIALALSGMDKLYINAEGELVAEVSGHPVKFAKPYAYQKVEGSAKAVSVEYALAGPGKARLQIGDYDKNLELTIDPLLSYSTYLGGSQSDTANGIAVDAAGFTYITGQTCSIGADLPAPVPFPGGAAFKGSLGACNEYITKLSVDGKTIQFTTIIAGTTPDPATGFASGNGIALDDISNTSPVPNGYTNVYVVGTTSFHDMPVIGLTACTPSNFWSGAESDAFIAILNSNTGTLIRTTYLGGSRPEEGYGIAVDKHQNVIVVGQTESNDFPAYNGFEPKTEDYVAFVTKLDFGLHIPAIDPACADTTKICAGASAMTPRPTSLTDSCGVNCPATPDPTKTYYFFSALYGGQLVAPISTWPVIGGAYPPIPFNLATGLYLTPPAFVPVAVPQNAITSGTPTICPGQANNPLALVAESVGPTSASYPQTAQGLLWICSSLTVNDRVADVGGFNWRILGPVPGPQWATSEAYGVALDPGGDVYAVGGSNTASLVPANLYWLPGTHYVGTGAWIVKLLGSDTSNGARNAGAPVLITPLETTPTDLTQQVDTARAVAVDSRNRAYVVGTASGGIYTTAGSLNPNAISNANNAFILRLSNTGSAIEYSTYLGGTGNDQGLGVAVDASFYAYVTGSTTSTDIPVRNAIVDGSGNTLSQLEGAQNAYVAKVSADGTQLIMSAYLGGNGADQGNAIAVSKIGNGDFYIAGKTTSTNFPVVPLDTPSNHVVGRTYSADNGVAGDAFVSMISGASFPKLTLSTANLTFPDQAVGWASTSTQVRTVTLTNGGTATLNFVSPGISASNDFSISNNTCGNPPNAHLVAGGSCTVTLSFKPTSAGGRGGTVTIVDDAIDSPQSVGLHGNGVLVSDSVSPVTLSFGSIAFGAVSAEQTVTVTNTDPAQWLIPSSVVINTTGSATPEFSVSSNTCSSLVSPNGGTCTIGVKFTPSLPGSQAGTLIINGNGNTFPATVQLTGTGNGAGSIGTGSTTGAAVTLTPSVTTVPVTKGTPASFTVTLVPSTLFTGTVQLVCTPTGNTTCTISPTSILVVSGTASYTATVTVNIPTGNSITIGSLMKPGRLLATLLPFGAIGLVFAGRRRRWLLMLGLAVCLALGMVACGGGGSSSSGAPPQVTITATPQTGTAPPPLVVSLNVS